jgi:hypothetical protein
VRVEAVPWGIGKHQLTKADMLFLAHWAEAVLAGDRDFVSHDLGQDLPVGRICRAVGDRAPVAGPDRGDCDGYETALKKTRWCVLKRKTNRTRQQQSRLRDLLRYNLQTVRAYLLKEDFQQLWEYDAPSWVGKFLDDWCCQVMRSRIVKTLR